MMKGKLTYYFILNPLIIFLVYALSPILFHKEKYINMKDALGILVVYYVLISGYYFMDVVSKRMKKTVKKNKEFYYIKPMEDNNMTENEIKFRDTTIRNFFDKEDRLKSIPGQKKKKLVLLEYLISKLNAENQYTEKKSMHSSNNIMTIFVRLDASLLCRGLWTERIICTV